MQRLIIPTAPSERHKWVQPQPRRTGWLILSLLLSLGAGFAGALMARVYQLEWFTPTTPDIVVVPNTAGSAAAVIVQKLQDDQAEAMVLVRSGDSVLGPGVVLSADGWIVVSAVVVGDNRSLEIETKYNKTYEVDAVVPDSVSGLVYLHVPSTGLRVADFRDTELMLGESVIAYSRTAVGDSVAFANVSTEAMIDRPLPNQVGAPLYDFDLAVVGFVTDTGAIIPIQLVNEVAYNLFTTGKIER